MDGLIQIAQILFILSLLVILHEFGHFIPAKLFKVRVEKFYLFMDAGFSLFKKKIGETEWGIGWLPIGGYVKLSGMIDESMDAEQMKQPAQPWEFRSKKPWQRLIIMLGGVTVNIILAWFLYTTIFITWGQKIPSTEIVQKNGLAFGESGLNAGFMNGDKILAIDGKKTQEKFNRAVIDLLLCDEVEVNRNGQNIKFKITDEQKSKILGSEGKGFVSRRSYVEDIYIDSINTKKVKINIELGDIILGINNKKLIYFDEIYDNIKSHKNSIIQLLIDRKGKHINVPVKVKKNGTIGLGDWILFNKNFNLNEVKIKAINSNSGADKSDLKANDKILGFNNLKYTNYKDFKLDLYKFKNKTINLIIIREGQEKIIETNVDKNGKLGLSFNVEAFEKKKYEITNELSLAQAIPAAVEESYTQFVYNIKQFKLLLRPKTEAYKHVKSPIGITRQLPTEWDWEFVWTFTAMFSIGLAFMNLLPIPGLDGGHALFTIAEMITGKTLSDKNAERVQTVGMVILLSLMALTFGKDIYQLIMDKFF